MKKYMDKNTNEIETYSQIEEYYMNNPEIFEGFNSVEDLISQFYSVVKE